MPTTGLTYTYTAHTGLLLLATHVRAVVKDVPAGKLCAGPILRRPPLDVQAAPQKLPPRATAVIPALVDPRAVSPATISTPVTWSYIAAVFQRRSPTTPLLGLPNSGLTVLRCLCPHLKKGGYATPPSCCSPLWVHRASYHARPRHSVRLCYHPVSDNAHDQPVLLTRLPCW